MNTERFYRVARLVRDEIETLHTVTNLEALLTGLQSLANQPADANAQRQVSEARTALRALGGAGSNDWSSLDRQVVEELSLNDSLGQPLLDRLENVLGANEMTPSVAVGEVTPMVQRVREVRDHLNALIAAMEYLDVPSELPVGDAEIR